MVDNFWKYEKSDNIHYRFLKNPQSDTAIIFIHGLGASNSYWSKDYNQLGHDNSLYFIDLLGFGYSAKPNKPYDLNTHITALRQFMRTQVPEKHITLVGHSAGAIIALAYFRQYPERIAHVLLLSLPFFSSRKVAQRALQNPNHALITIFNDSMFSQVLCRLTCWFRPLFLLFANDFISGYPSEVAHDALLYTCASYFGTLQNIVFNQNIPQLLRRRKETKISLIHGYHDTIVSYESISKLSKEFNIPLTAMKTSGHDFPLFQEGPMVEIISKLRV